MKCFIKRQNTGRVAILLTGIILFQSCGPYGDYQSARQEVQRARNQLQIAQEFHSLFPNSISRKAEGKYGQALMMETALYDRYVLTLFVKYSIDQIGNIVGSSDPPKLILREV